MVFKYRFDNIGESTNEADVIKDNEVYHLTDNKMLQHLVLSKTVLHRNQETRGHTHDEQEEVYFFVSGTGEMQVGDHMTMVTQGDIVLVPKGKFHKVINKSNQDLVFNCVFEGKRNH